MKRLMTQFQWPAHDPRWYQIAALAGLLLYGAVWLRFDVTFAASATILSVALLSQYLCTQLWRLPEFDPRSALISGLSLCLLLRSDSLGLAAVAAVAAIASKFILRWNGKHLFNPTNFAIVALLLLANGRVWVSPGQWGSGAFFGFLMACVGGLVVTRAARADVTLGFLAAYCALLFGRSLWLGEPMSIPLHRVQNGALLLFAFFMISDPRTTPDSRVGRILFATLVAFGAAFVQFKLFRTNGLLWSLAAFTFLVPVLDWLLPGGRYSWRRASPLVGGDSLATVSPLTPALSPLRGEGAAVDACGRSAGCTAFSRHSETEAPSAAIDLRLASLARRAPSPLPRAKPREKDSSSSERAGVRGEDARDQAVATNSDAPFLTARTDCTSNFERTKL